MEETDCTGCSTQEITRCCYRTTVGLIGRDNGTLLIVILYKSVPFSMGVMIDKVSNEQKKGKENSNIFKQKSLSEMFALLTGVFVIGAAANTGRVYLFRCVGER